MANYVREQSVGDLIRNTFALFGKGFGVIFLTYFLPMFPFKMWQLEAQAAGAKPLILITFFCSTMMGLLAYGAITVSVSDICLGHAPSLVRSYKKVFGLYVRMFTASMLQIIFILVGMALLVVPGIIAVVWCLFTPSVVVLEGLGGLAAVKRSKAIGQGYFWRILGIVGLIIVIAVAAYVVLAVPFLLILPKAAGHFPGRLFDAVVQSLTPPLAIVTFVLTYYDLRVRKEAYDAEALAEDLRR